MLNAIRPMVDSGMINEETRVAITEAWNSQLAEAKEQVRSELREEFAQRYQHDKKVMVEALDKLVTESLKQEIAAIKQEKTSLTEDRIKLTQKVKTFFAENLAKEVGEFRKDANDQKLKMIKLESFIVENLANEVAEFRQEHSEVKTDHAKLSNKLKSFMAESLANEIQDLRNERKIQKESLSKLESFVMQNLAKEIYEFNKDKKDLVETKVKLIAGAKQKLAEMQQNFINRSTKLVQESVAGNLKHELSQLKGDIKIARENMFGRRIFEAYASEFGVSHLNENKEIAKLRSLVEAKNRQLAKTKQIAEETKKLVESKQQEVKVLKENAQRTTLMSELLKPLNKEKASIMRELLENVQTTNLQSAYDKYLPSVLTVNATSTPTNNGKAKMLNEQYGEVTGDKIANANESTHTTDNVIELKRLAGLK